MNIVKVDKIFDQDRDHVTWTFSQASEQETYRIGFQRGALFALSVVILLATVTSFVTIALE